MSRSLIEEKWNSITHSIMFGFFVGYLIGADKPLRLFCFGLATTMLFSSLYHAVEEKRRKNNLRKLDMMSIHVTIMTTGAAYVMAYGQAFFIYLVLLVGFLGIYYIQANYGTKGFEGRVSMSFVLFGLAAAVLATLSIVLSGNSYNLISFVLGIIFYLTGLVFYVKDVRKWYHTVWHLFVIGGSLVHLNGL